MFPTKNEILLVLTGGSGMWMLLSFTGQPADYWHICAGAWGYGLTFAWYKYGDSVLKYFAELQLSAKEDP